MNFLRRYVGHNLFLKLIALASATMLWSAVAREPRAEVAHTVPIEFVNVPSGMAINSDKVPEVQIWLSGPVRMVRAVEATDLHPVIDLTHLQRGSGDRTYSLSNSQIKAPYGVEIVQVVPSEFHLSFDVLATRKVRVQPRVSGQVAAQRTIAEVVSDPDVVFIQGPRSRVNAIEQAITDPIDASGVRGRQTFTTTVYVNDPMVRVLQPSVVHVTVITAEAASAGGPNQ